MPICHREIATRGKGANERITKHNATVTIGWQTHVGSKPFGGSGTVGMVARWLGRDSILCELNPEYVAMIEERVLMPREKRALDDVPESQLDLFGGQR